MLQCFVCLSSVRIVLWLNGASQSKSYYWQPIGSRIWEIDWYQNEWPWPLFRGRIKVMSTIALESTFNISETVRDRDHQKTTDRKWHMGYQMDTWPMTSRDPQKVTLVTPCTLRAQYLANGWICYATIANYYLVCCEAIRSAILATAWLHALIWEQLGFCI